jgi:hypothetical protein
MNKIIICLSTIVFLSLNVIFAQNNPPSVSFNSPVNNEQFETGDIFLSASVTDEDNDITKVAFFANDSSLKELNAQPFEYYWKSVTDGHYELAVKVYDSFGYQRTDRVQINVGDELIWRPYLGYPIKLPGRIEVEYFDNGGPEISYHESDDNKKGCDGNKCRPDELVDIGATIDEKPENQNYNYFLGYTFPGNEWLDYTVQVDSAGEYVLKARIATSLNSRSFHLEKYGEHVTDTIVATNTLEYDKNEWYNYKNIYEPGVILSKGTYTLRLVIHEMNGSYGGLNFNYIEFIHPSQNPPVVNFITPLNTDTIITKGDDLLIRIAAQDLETDVEKVELYRDNQLITSLTAPPYVYTFDNPIEGNFKIFAKAYDSEGNSEVTLRKHIQVKTPAVNVDRINKGSIYVYPNPFNNSFNIDFDNEMMLDTELIIFSLDAKVLERISIQSSEISGRYIVRPKNIIDHGIYLMKIIHGQSAPQTVYLIKQ